MSTRERWQIADALEAQAKEIEALRQDMQTTADALGHRDFEIQNVMERNRELELCIARHADEQYSLRFALENCRLLAARHRKESWALLILGFCAEGGVVGSITRDIIKPIGKESQAVCDSILKDEYK